VVDHAHIIAWSTPILDGFAYRFIDPPVQLCGRIGDGLQAVAELIGLVRTAIGRCGKCYETNQCQFSQGGLRQKR
jgi:hypothetical protein